MAIATGSQIRPELSAVDYTPFLQASGQSAQMQAQGITSAVGGALKGFESYLQNKEKDKQYLGIIKAADTLTKGFEPILEKVDPRIATALSDLRSRITDPNISTAERASAAQSFMAQAPSLLNAGVKMLDTQTVVDARTAQLQERKDSIAEKNMIAAASKNRALGKEAGFNLTPDQESAVTIGAAKLMKEGKTTERVDKIINGRTVPVEVTTNLITGKVSESVIREPFQSPQDVKIAESNKLQVQAGAERLKQLDTNLDQARTQEEFANQLSDAIQSGATTGAFAEASGSVKNLLESVFGGDYGAATQRLFAKAAKGITMTQVRGMWKGLGSMSDTDLKEGIKTFGIINDPKKAVEYYIEASKINKERLDEQKQLSKSLLKKGLTQDEVASQLDDVISQYKPISELAKEKIGFNPNTDISVNTSTQPNQPKVNFPSQEAISAEIARRRKSGK